MTVVTKVIIIHGSFGSPEINWFPWLRGQIESIYCKVFTPKFPTPDGQQFEEWKKVLLESVGNLDQDTILIGHSVGCGFILNILNDQNASSIRATFLVSGFTGKIGRAEYDRVNESFVSQDFDWELIRRKAGSIFVISGENDPYVPAEKGVFIADCLKVPLTIVPNGRHLNEEHGYSKFPLLEEKLRPFIGSTQTKS